MALHDAFEHCLAEVRRHDPDRFACLLFAGPPGRRGLVALHAFHLELARLRDQVREPLLGAMRLQWWREGLEGIMAGNPRLQPVAVALADTAARHALPSALLADMIDGRERDFDGSAFASLAELEGYVRGNAGVLGAAAMAVLGGDAAAQDAARAAGTAFGLVGVVRALPFHATQGRWLLPDDLMAREGATRDTALLGRMTPELARVVAAVLRRAEEIGPPPAAVSRSLRPALLPAALARAQARRLAVTGYDPFRMAELDPLARALVLGRAYWLGV